MDQNNQNQQPTAMPGDQAQAPVAPVADPMRTPTPVADPMAPAMPQAPVSETPVAPVETPAAPEAPMPAGDTGTGAPQTPPVTPAA